jgi:quercetin dioxygenase-like cupin family protein
MRYARIVTGADGETRFVDAEAAYTRVDYAPPAQPLDAGVAMEATQVSFVRFPAGWVGEWHAAPHRQFLAIMAGELTAETGDGEVRVFPAGTVLRVEDTTGRGHRSWVSSACAVEALVTVAPGE